ncbi:MAG: arylesterase [Rhodospirillales bacterium]|nr:arylesterase [Rhodospirillales bacterium]
MIALLVLGLAFGLAATSAHADENIRVLAFGDSLTAGYGLPKTDSFPAKLEQSLHARGIKATVTNAGVSGDTTAGGRARLTWALESDPHLAIVELGANDAMRGIEPGATWHNLDAIVSALKDRGIKVLLAGMFAPPNYGDRFAQNFDDIYPRLADRHGVLLYPFFLDGVAADPALNQADGIHPTAAGIDRIVERILPYVLQLIETPSN